MKKNNYLTIKEFSTLTHTPIDTLKHYDRIDLLKPAYIGENNYRYYLPEQAFLLTRILFGVKAKVLLSEIKSIILDDNPDKSYNHYIHINDNLQQMINELQAIQGTIASLKYYYDLTIKNRKTIYKLLSGMVYYLFAKPEPEYSCRQRRIKYCG